MRSLFPLSVEWGLFLIHLYVHWRCSPLGFQHYGRGLQSDCASWLGPQFRAEVQKLHGLAEIFRVKASFGIHCWPGSLLWFLSAENFIFCQLIKKNFFFFLSSVWLMLTWANITFRRTTNCSTGQTVLFIKQLFTHEHTLQGSSLSTPKLLEQRPSWNT